MRTYKCDNLKFKIYGCHTCKYEKEHGEVCEACYDEDCYHDSGEDSPCDSCKWTPKEAEPLSFVCKSVVDSYLLEGFEDFVYDHAALNESLNNLGDYCFEVIPCKICKSATPCDEDEKVVYCSLHGTIKLLDDFCSYGEKRR